MSSVRFQHSGWYTRQNVEASPDVFIGKVKSSHHIPFVHSFKFQSNLFQIAHGSYDNWWHHDNIVFPFLSLVRRTWLCVGLWLLRRGMWILGRLQVRGPYLLCWAQTSSWQQPWLTISTTTINLHCRVDCIVQEWWWRNPLAPWINSPCQQGHWWSGLRRITIIWW